MKNYWDFNLSSTFEKAFCKSSFFRFFGSIFVGFFLAILISFVVIYTIYNLIYVSTIHECANKLKQILENLNIVTKKKNFVEITNTIEKLVSKSGISYGFLNLSIMHTSCSLMIQENADYTVLEDIKDFLSRIAPENFKYNHNSEGPDDMPSHIKSMLTQTNLTLSIKDSKLLLGTWQGIFVLEHRNSDKQRSLIFHLIGN